LGLAHIHFNVIAHVVSSSADEEVIGIVVDVEQVGIAHGCERLWRDTGEPSCFCYSSAFLPHIGIPPIYDGVIELSHDASLLLWDMF